MKIIMKTIIILFYISLINIAFSQNIRNSIKVTIVNNNFQEIIEIKEPSFYIDSNNFIIQSYLLRGIWNKLDTNCLNIGHVCFEINGGNYYIHLLSILSSTRPIDYPCLEIDFFRKKCIKLYFYSDIARKKFNFIYKLFQ